MNSHVAERRLRNQGITRPRAGGAAAVVSMLGAVQAQEFEPAKWALGLRMPPGATAARLERAFAAGQILRTHVLRPTWHFVARADIRWMLALTAPRVHLRMAPYDRQLGLDAPLMTRALGAIERALGERDYQTRAELRVELSRAALPVDAIRLAHIMMYAELEALVCSGPRRDGQFTYALLAARAPDARVLPPDEALATLTRRFFASHGPATVRDFVWWSGLTTPDAKRGLEIVRARQTSIDGDVYWTTGGNPRLPARRSRAGRSRPIAHLLPVYDEYLVAYRVRKAVPHGPSVVPARVGPAILFQHAVVIDGQVAGTWRTARKDDGVAVTVAALRRLTPADRRAVLEAAARYERFVGVPVSLTMDR